MSTLVIAEHSNNELKSVCRNKSSSLSEKDIDFTVKPYSHYTKSVSTKNAWYEKLSTKEIDIVIRSCLKLGYIVYIPLVNQKVIKITHYKAGWLNGKIINQCTLLTTYI
jgi:hypothetical protein